MTPPGRFDLTAFERPLATWSRLKAVLLVAVAVAALIPLATLVHRIADITRGSPVTALRYPPGGAPAAGDPVFTALMALYAEAPLAPGHAIEIMTDGPESMARMSEDLAAATRSITLQTYYCRPGTVADELVGILTDRAAAGVQVLFLGDGFGCRKVLRQYGDELRAAGVAVATLRPLRWYDLHRAQHRSHVRAVVVDGVVGHTGGLGLDDKWLGTEEQPPWRDTHVRFTGPAVAQLQAAFARGWAEATGELLLTPEFFPDAGAATGETAGPEAWDGDGRAALPSGDAPEGNERAAVAGILHFQPGLGSTSAERFLSMSIAGARRTLYVTNAYFVPDATSRRLLRDAASRGVDVRILTAGRQTDVPTTRYAGRGFYTELLEAGVRIYEYEPVMMHAKTLAVDGVWSSIGSMNFDNRSLRLDDELNLLVNDRAIGAALDSIFFDDLRRAREIRIESFGERPRRERAVEWLVRRAAPLL